MKLAYSILFLIIISVSCLAQDKALVDSLEIVLPTLRDTARIKALRSLAWEYGFSDLDKAKKTAAEGIEVARELGDSAWVAHACIAYYTVAYRQNDLATAKSYAEKSLANCGPDQLEIKGKAYVILGLVASHMGEADNAINYQLNGAKIFEELGDSANASRCYTNVSSAYFEVDDDPKTREYAKLALSYLQGSNANPYGMGGIYGMMGLSWENENLDSAIYYQQKGLEQFEVIGAKHNIAISAGNLGNYHRKKGEKEIGAEYYERALSIARETEDVGNTAKYLCNLGVVDLEKKKFDEALLKYREAEDLISGKGFISQEQQVREGLSESYAGLGNHKLALEQYTESITLRDSVHNQSRVARMEELEAKFQVEKTENELAQCCSQQLQP